MHVPVYAQQAFRDLATVSAQPAPGVEPDHSAATRQEPSVKPYPTPRPRRRGEGPEEVRP